MELHLHQKFLAESSAVKSSDFVTEYSHFNVIVKSLDSYSERISSI
jgi:hypothetical protein